MEKNMVQKSKQIIQTFIKILLICDLSHVHIHCKCSHPFYLSDFTKASCVYMYVHACNLPIITHPDLYLKVF